VQYFAVTLSLAASDPEWMKPGQRVRAEVLMEDLPGVLTVSRQAVFERRGGKVVYRFAGGAFEPVEVTTGAVGRGRVVVAGPLEEGDRVALQDPTGAGEPGPAAEEAADAGDVPAPPPLPGGAR
jgi:hypothetical protein